MNTKIIKQFFKYGTVGVFALGVDVGIFTLARAMGLDLVSANVLARFSGAVAAYTGNFLWTFDQTAKLDGWLRSSWRYAALWGGATLISTLLLSTLTGLGFNETVCKLSVEMTMPFVNFFFARVWVFRTMSKNTEGAQVES
ncbi:MAG: hypothetical protein FD135_1188 [Comamonadaceae bacterium]|nr:MAG: hypothetical protein FD135_1188 [Comamonadaceae bacterium]